LGLKFASAKRVQKPRNVWKRQRHGDRLPGADHRTQVKVLPVPVSNEACHSDQLPAWPDTHSHAVPGTW